MLRVYGWGCLGWRLTVEAPLCDANDVWRVSSFWACEGFRCGDGEGSGEGRRPLGRVRLMQPALCGKKQLGTVSLLMQARNLDTSADCRLT